MSAKPEAPKAVQEFVGYTKAPSGKHYLIGVGPLDWLKARMHAIEGGEFFYRDVTPDDMEAPYYHERDLSGAEARGDK
jgi:hypothetical protein